MKALSLTRPWDWTIVHGGKRIENRSRKDGVMPNICRHRGPLLLHAAKSLDRGVRDWCRERGLSLPPAEGIATGAIVGRCIAVGYIDNKGYSHFDDTPPEGIGIGMLEKRGFDVRWWMGGHALLLNDLEPLPTVECRGALGCWNVPDDVMTQLNELLKKESA